MVDAITFARCDDGRGTTELGDQLERQQDVEELFSVTIPLHLGDLTAFSYTLAVKCSAYNDQKRAHVR